MTPNEIAYINNDLEYMGIKLCVDLCDMRKRGEKEKEDVKDKHRTKNRKEKTGK